MARNLFPNERFVAGVCRTGRYLQLVNGLDLEVFTDEACTTLADLQDTEFQPIAGSIITVDDSQLPRFYGPDTGATVLYIRRAGDANADVETIYAYGVSAGTSSYYVHTQSVPSATWTVNHNLGFPPSPTIVTSSGDMVLANLTYPEGEEGSTLIINFSGALAGKAYLS